MKHLLKTALILLVILPTFCLGDPSTFAERKEVQEFITTMVETHQFNREQLQQWFNQITLQPSILQAISKPAEKAPWHRYQAIFMTPLRIEEGVKFWQKNETLLNQAYEKYGVEPEYIVAILGVETLYGKGKGRYKVLDSLATLGFDYPPRSKFFLSELEQFLLLAREENWNPTEIKGSYAGAMGVPQFIPSSYRRYAIDFTGNGKRDLLNGDADAIGSIANYFKMHGWQTKDLVVLPAKANTEQVKSYIASKFNPKPQHTLAFLKQQGLKFESSVKLDENKKFALISLENKEGPEYWLGAQNFYVITRYNHSDHYAMAVYNLSQEVKKRFDANKLTT